MAPEVQGDMMYYYRIDVAPGKTCPVTINHAEGDGLGNGAPLPRHPRSYTLAKFAALINEARAEANDRMAAYAAESGQTFDPYHLLTA
jgi:hypothetical protein